MKKSLLSTIAASLFCISTVSYANNINQGTIEIGGDLDFSVFSGELKPEQGNGKTEIDSTYFSANALYYIQPNLGLGIIWNYESTESTEFYLGSIDANEESSTTEFGPIVSYNMSINEQTSFKLQGGVTIISSERYNLDMSGFGWLIGGQLSYFINENISFDTSLGYTSGTIENDNSVYADIDISGFGIGVGLSIYLN